MTIKKVSKAPVKKTVVKKAADSKKLNFLTEKVIKVYEFTPEKIPTGTYFEASRKKGGEKFFGLIYNDKRRKRIYLCQNERTGSTAPKLLGFAYSYMFDYNSFKSSSRIEEGGEFFDITLGPKPKDFKVPELPPKIEGHIPIIQKGHVKIGCRTIPNKSIVALVKFLKD